MTKCPHYLIHLSAAKLHKVRAMSASLAWRANIGLPRLSSIWKTFRSSKMNSIHWDLWLLLRKLFPCRSVISIVAVQWHCVYTPLWESLARIDTIYLIWWVFPLWDIVYPSWDSGLLLALGPVLIERSLYGKSTLNAVTSPLSTATRSTNLGPPLSLTHSSTYMTLNLMVKLFQWEIKIIK